MTEEDKGIVRTESQESSREENKPDPTREKIHIPDYVMQDFAFPREKLVRR